MYNVKFPPGSIKDMVQLALEMTGVKPSQYKYDPNGSTVNFTASQLKNFMGFLEDALKDEYMAEEHEEINNILTHVRDYVINDSRIAQASDSAPTGRAQKLLRVASAVERHLK